jgi:hypothetical protein
MDDQNDYAEALSKFPSLHTIDLCASVHQLRAEPTLGRRLIFARKMPNPEDILTDVKSPTHIAQVQKRATLLLARRCPSLRRVTWSAPGWRLDTSPLTVWIWRVVGEGENDEAVGADAHDGAGDVGDDECVAIICEGVKERTSRWDEIYHQMSAVRTGAPLIVEPIRTPFMYRCPGLET